ncbi:hypothetical protein IQ06DRAFT_8008 [Phaeosphaeriaceae sp. SRC1lsM3a]|nr:hypothetical protein IQ06DRAFT_8008 [Stagonospora sp. SRC1lsM3a]
MSQANRGYPPNFNLIVQEPRDQFAYNGVIQQPANNISQQQWMQHRSRSVQLNNIPSPVNSVVSAMTFPSQQRRSFDVSSFHQNSAVSNDRGHDDLLGMDMLAPSAPVARNSYSPVGRDYNEESWNPLNLRTSDTGSNFHRNDGSMRSFRHGPGSVGNAAPRSDSGFYSQSVISHDASCMDRSPIQYSPTQRIGDIAAYPTPTSTQQMLRVPSDQQSHVSHTSSHSGNADNPLKCQECGVISKCKSDDKKHQLKHEKPWRCDIPKCKRKEGFTTSNDLDRHKKSVHRMRLLDKSYQCKARSCKNRGKIWPRRDNFKQHIERMHPEEDVEELIKRSTILPKPPGNNTETLSVAPIDTIVLGMDKSVSSQSSYEPVMELTPVDQDMTQWAESLDPTGFPLNLHQNSSSLPRSAQDLRRLDVLRKPDRTGYRRQKHGEPSQQVSRGGLMNVDREVQSRSGSIAEQQRNKQPSTSNKPQTKAEQQRLALKKFSQAVSRDSSTDVDLEQAVLRILAGTSEQTESESEESEHMHGRMKRRTQPGGSNVFLSKSEAIKAAQAISNLIKQSPGSAYSQPRKTNQNFVANPKICNMCDYAVARACDLKKHMKRHEKPYGCTYPKCHRRFGAKSDWKRHENSQHFQLEAYRCSQMLPNGKPCGEHFFRVENFKKHLESQHKMCKVDDQITEAKRRRIGKNCQQQFWCGFHGDIIELKEKRNAAWDERFDHIAFHFEKDRRSIEEWICAEENKTKKELMRELDRYSFSDDEDEGGRGKAPPPPPPLMTSLGIPFPPPPPPPHSTAQHNSRKRSMSVEIEPNWSHKKQRTHRDPQTRLGDGIFRFCCQCGDGPSNVAVQPSCTSCSHVDVGCCDTGED